MILCCSSSLFYVQFDNRKICNMNIMNSLPNLVKLIKVFNENYGNRNTHFLSVMNQITIYRNKCVYICWIEYIVRISWCYYTGSVSNPFINSSVLISTRTFPKIIRNLLIHSKRKIRGTIQNPSSSTFESGFSKWFYG